MKKAFIQLHIAVFLAGFTAILGKLITLNEGLLVWYRLFITVVTLWLLLYLKKEFDRLSVKNTVLIFGVGTIVAMHWVCFYGSIKYANVSVSLTCFSAVGFFTSIFEPVIMKRKIDLFEVFLGLLAIAGIYLIFDFYPQYKTGILFGIISALLASLFPIFNKNLLKNFSAKTVTLYEMTGGLLALSLIIPFYLKFFPAEYYLPSVTDWLWLLVLAWLCTVLSFILQLNALKRVSPFTANLTYNLEPIYGIMLAFIIFHENKYLSSGFYYGLALILLAVILQMVRVWKRNEKMNSVLRETQDGH
ncbi:MAG: DMT family transporter [Chitinophagaceae bacterium]|nr:DMT family transporter [Chitinophagaceae bacterium]